MRRAVILTTRTLLVISLACCGACQRGSQSSSTAYGALPPSSSGELKFVGTPPAHPFHPEAGNYYGRTIFEADGPAYSHIEVREVLIPPHTKSHVRPLPGPAVLDLTTGDARLMIGNQPEALTAGAMRAISAGEMLQLENPNPQPAIVRLYVIRRR
jgi:hypothetical protein